MIARDLVEIGACSPACRCGGAYHGSLTYAEVPAMADVPDETAWLCRRCGLTLSEGYIVRDNYNAWCTRCLNDEHRGHFYVAPTCRVRWHDKWDHPENFAHFKNRREGLAFRRHFNLDAQAR